jgi:glycosidase
MWGADDPDDRKPMIWADLLHEPESTAFDGSRRPQPDEVGVDRDVLSFYRELVELRRANAQLFGEGETRWNVVPPESGLVSYVRWYWLGSAIVVVNPSDQTRETGSIRSLLPDERPRYTVGEEIKMGDSVLRVPPRSGAVWILLGR